MIVSFLAVLELMKQKTISVEQSELFAEILISRKEVQLKIKNLKINEMIGNRPWLAEFYLFIRFFVINLCHLNQKSNRYYSFPAGRCRARELAELTEERS